MKVGRIDAMESLDFINGSPNCHTYMSPRRWYSISEACEHFGLKSSKTLYNLAARGRLPGGAGHYDVRNLSNIRNPLLDAGFIKHFGRF